MCRNNIQSHMRFNLTEFSPYSRCKSPSSYTEAAQHKKCVIYLHNRAEDSCCASKKRKKRLHRPSNATSKLVSHLLILFASLALISLPSVAHCQRQGDDDSIANINSNSRDPAESMMTLDREHANSERQLSDEESFDFGEPDEPDTDDDYDVNVNPKHKQRYEQQSGKTAKSPYDDDYDVSKSPDLLVKYLEQKLENSKNNYMENDMSQPTAPFHRRPAEQAHKSSKFKYKNDEIETGSGSSPHAIAVDSNDFDGTCVNSMPGGCKSRVDMEKESIKKHLLFKLNMKNPPNITKKQKFTTDQMRLICQKYNFSEEECFGVKSDYQSDGFGFMNDNNDYDSDEMEDDAAYHYAETRQRITTFPRLSHTIRHKNHNRQLGLEFTFPSSQTASQDIMQATLNLFLLNGQRLKQFKNVEFIDIEISVQMANASSQEVYEKHRLIPVERQENVEGKNFPINITKLVKAWYNSKEEKHKIFFSVSNSMTSEKLPIRIIASDLNNLATSPSIDIVPIDRRKLRVKRSPVTCTDDKCCRRELTVNFAEFGWDWIIAPRQYDANYCQGTCGNTYRIHYGHTHVMQMSTSASPCCSPRKLGHIQLLYFDDLSRVVLSKIPNMRVEECFCS